MNRVNSPGYSALSAWIGTSRARELRGAEHHQPGLGPVHSGLPGVVAANR